MERKSIGSFIAALRRASGMTQQELAEKLNVSNKTVSKWECDGGDPELALIPVLAEIFGVTCDDILRGERIKDGATSTVGAADTSGTLISAEKEQPRVDKQISRLLEAVLARLNITAFIAVSISLIGLVLFLLFAYGVYDAYTAFSLFVTIIVASSALIISMQTYAKSTIGKGMFKADDLRILPAQRKLNRITFGVLFTNLVLVLLAIPIGFFGPNPSIVITASEYFRGLFPYLLIVSPIIMLAFVVYVQSTRKHITAKTVINRLRKLNTVFLIISGALFCFNLYVMINSFGTLYARDIQAGHSVLQTINAGIYLIIHQNMFEQVKFPTRSKDTVNKS